MLTRYWRLILFVTLLPGVALAGRVEDSIISQLAGQGFTEIQISRTWLGRSRIVAKSKTATREIVVNPTTGAILRDYWQAIGEQNEGPELIDPESSAGSDGSDNQGSGSGSGGNGNNSGQGGGGSNGGHGSGDDGEGDNSGPGGGDDGDDGEGDNSGPGGGDDGDGDNSGHGSGDDGEGDNSGHDGGDDGEGDNSGHGGGDDGDSGEGDDD